jgi:hypothetical protein
MQVRVTSISESRTLMFIVALGVLAAMLLLSFAAVATYWSRVPLIENVLEAVQEITMEEQFIIEEMRGATIEWVRVPKRCLLSHHIVGFFRKAKLSSSGFRRASHTIVVVQSGRHLVFDVQELDGRACGARVSLTAKDKEWASSWIGKLKNRLPRLSLTQVRQSKMELRRIWRG